MPLRFVPRTILLYSHCFSGPCLTNFRSKPRGRHPPCRPGSPIGNGGRGPSDGRAHHGKRQPGRHLYGDADAVRRGQLPESRGPRYHRAGPRDGSRKLGPPEASGFDHPGADPRRTADAGDRTAYARRQVPQGAQRSPDWRRSRSRRNPGWSGRGQEGLDNRRSHRRGCRNRNRLHDGEKRVGPARRDGAYVRRRRNGHCGGPPGRARTLL